MVFRKLAAAMLAWLAALMPLPAVAEVDNCRSLEMRLLQLQAGAGKASISRSVRDMLVQRRCRAGPPKAARDVRAPEIRARPVARARPVTSAKAAARVKPPAVGRPAVKAKPVTSAKAVARVKPPASGSPAAKAKPRTSAKAVARVKPAGSRRPAAKAKVKAVTGNKAVASAEPAAIAKPAAMERPRRERAPRPRPEAKYEPGASLADETFRTLCVRSCDGYYFPISFSTTRENFRSDQAICDQMCPAAGSRLYVHGVEDGGPENMVSVDGSAYAELPSAFKYRSAVDDSCTCRKPGSDQAGAPSTKAPGGALTQVRIAPPPRPRWAFGEDPETLANRAGGLDPDALREPDFAKVAELERSVRIVWPERHSQQGDLMISAVPN